MTENKSNDNDATRPCALTLTFLTNVSMGSLNGSDKEADNVSNIKKLTRGAKTYPYMSSQAVRRALRDQLGTMGHQLSEGQVAGTEKGAAITQCLPMQFIDDDLFGFMNAQQSGTHKRTSPIRVSPLLSIDPYEGDLDFGTNYMAVEEGGNPNIFETEIHGGLYRGTVLIELDAVGNSRTGEWKSTTEREPWMIEVAEKATRVNALLKSIQHLWSSGRQSRFLADISPKFVAAALLKAKVPIFLESVERNGQAGINTKLLKESLSDAESIVSKHCFGVRSGQFELSGNEITTVSIGEAFKTIKKWVDDYYTNGGK